MLVKSQLLLVFSVFPLHWRGLGKSAVTFFDRSQEHCLLRTFIASYPIEKWYKHIMEPLKGAQWILQCAGWFAMTGGDIVSRPTNSNFNKTRLCTLFFQPNIVSITISCNAYQCFSCNVWAFLCFACTLQNQCSDILRKLFMY